MYFSRHEQAEHFDVRTTVRDTRRDQSDTRDTVTSRRGRSRTGLRVQAALALNYTPE